MEGKIIGILFRLYLLLSLPILSQCNNTCKDRPIYTLGVPIKRNASQDTFNIGDTIKLYVSFNLKNMPAKNSNELIDISKYPVNPYILIYNITDSSRYGLGWNSFKVQSTVKYFFNTTSDVIDFGINQFNYNSEYVVNDTIGIICKEKGAFILTSDLIRCYGNSTPGASCPKIGWACNMIWENDPTTFDPNHFLDLAQTTHRKALLNGESAKHDIRFSFLVQ